MLKGNNTSPQRHGHNYNWKGWEDWLPPSTQTHQHEESQPTPPYIPLSLKEQTKLRQRKNRITKVTGGGSNTTKPNKIKNSKGRTEKTGGSEDGEEGNYYNINFNEVDNEENPSEYHHSFYKSENAKTQEDLSEMLSTYPYLRMEFNAFGIEVFLKPVPPEKAGQTKVFGWQS